MFQTIQGHKVFVVDLPTFPPPMPITDGGDPALKRHAYALQDAIVKGTIKESGKYGIEVYYRGLNAGYGYNIYRIDEPHS